jgi:hypothetical protein
MFMSLYGSFPIWMERRLLRLSNHTSSSFERKIDGWIQENGWDPSLKDMAKAVYLGYEQTPDLDAEFPNIFSNYLSSFEKTIEARKQASLQRARQNRFVPGKGGAVGPSKPIEFKGDEDPRDIANKLWEQFQPGSGT